MNHAEYRQIKLSEHLDICGKRQFSVFPFYKILIDSSFIRKEKEKHFITRKCSIAAESHIRSHYHISSKIQLFW